MSVPEAWRGPYAPRDPLASAKPRDLAWPQPVLGPQDGATAQGTPGHDTRPLGDQPRRP